MILAIATDPAPLGAAADGTFALRVVWCATAAWLTAAAAAWALRRSAAAAVRHRIWSLSCLAVLALPALAPLLPEWRVGPGRAELPPAESPGRPVLSRTAGASPTPQDLASEPDATASVASRTVVRPAPGGLADEPPTATPQAPVAAAPALLPQPPAPARQPRVPWRVILWACWAMPVAWLTLRQVLSIRAARRLVRRGTVVDLGATGDLAPRLRRLAGRAGVRHLPELVQSADVASPVCVGLFRRCAVLLPPAWRRWDAAQLEAVLIHELAHLARCDVAWQMLARFAAAVYWFHPMAWVAAWRMRVERELACDDSVLRGGQPSTAYARYLLEVATAAATAGRPDPRAGAAGVAMAAAAGLERRVAAILDPARRRSPVSRRAGLLLAALAASVAVVTGVVNPTAPRLAAAAAAAPAPAAPAPATAPAPDPNTRVLEVAGRVEDGRGGPVGNAIVDVHCGAIRAQARSAADGRFALTLRGPADHLRYVTARATTPDGAAQTFRMLYDPRGDGQITDGQARDVRLTLRPAREFPVTVTDGHGHPVGGAWVAFGSAYRKAGEALTDAAGRATLRVPADAPPMHVVATKSGLGLDYRLFWRPDDVRTDPYRLPPDYARPIDLVLDGARTVTVRVRDDAGRPLAGVEVRPWVFERPKHGGGLNQALAELTRTTDAAGRATFDYIPAATSARLVLWTTFDGFSSPRRCVYDPASGEASLETTMLRRVLLAGRVADDAGRPVAGATVRYSGDGYGLDGCYGMTRTADDGSFAARVDAEQYYMVTADLGRLAARPQMRVVRREPPPPVELTLAPGTPVSGRVTTGDGGGGPVPGALVTLSLQDHGTHDRLPADRQLTAADDDHKAILPAVWRNQRADDRGAFEFYAAPGKYVLRAFAAPSFNAVREVTVTGREPVEVDLRPGGGGGGDAAGEPSPVQHVTPGRVVLRDRPDAGGVADVALTGRSAASDHFTGASDRQGNFTLRHGAADMYLYAVSDDGTLRGVVIARAADAAVTVPVGPTASAVGRLLDPEGKPIAGRPVRYGIRIGTPERGYSDSFGGTTRTAADGTFTVDGLVPGHEYHLTVAVSFYPNGEPRVWQGIGVATADGAGRVDLGDRRLPKPPAANEPRPWQAQQADAFAADAGPVEARLDEARERARAARLRVLVVLGAPGHAACDEFFQYASDPARYDVRGPLADYTVVAVDSDHNEQATVWARASDVPWPARGMTLAVLDPAGAVVARSAAEPLSVDGKLDRTRLAEFLTRNRPPGPSPATATAGQGAAAAGANDPGRVADPAHTGFRPGQKLPPLTAVAWRFRQEPTKVGGSLRWPGMTDPIAAGGDVYFGDDRGVLRALRAVDGAPVWTYEHGERILGPVVDDERVYFTSPTGVTAVRRADGKAAWQFDIEGGGSEAGGVVWAPTDTLFCGGGDGFVYAIDRRTGRQRWKHGVVADAPPDPPGFPGARARLGKSPARLTGVATDGRTVFQSVFDQSRVVAIDAATGERRWSFQARGWIHGAPAVGERHVFVGSQDGRLYCLDKATGNQAWSFATHGRVESTPGLADDRVFVASCDGTFYCLEVATAAIAWSFTTDRGPTGMRAIYSRPILTPDAVYFAAGEGQAYALGRENGRLLWKLRPSESSQLFTSPATDGTRLFLTTRAGIDESGETSVVAVGP